MECKKCGHINLQDAIFCENCGEKIEIEESKNNAELDNKDNKNEIDTSNESVKLEEQESTNNTNQEEIPNNNVTSTINTNNKPKKNNTLIIVLIVIVASIALPLVVLAVLLLTGYLSFSFLKTTKSTKTEKIKDIIEDKINIDIKDDNIIISDEPKQEENQTEQTETKKVVRTIYFYKYNDYDSYTASFSDTPEKNTTLANKYECYSECTYKTIQYSDNYYMIHDEKNIIYNAKKAKRIDFNLSGEFDEIRLAVDVDDNVKGVIINKTKYYDVKQGKITYETNNQFDADYITGFVSKGYIPINYGKESCGARALININTWKVLENSKVENKKYYSYSDINYISEGCDDYYPKSNILDDNFKPIFEEYHYNILKTKNNLVISYDNSSDNYSTYDLKTKTVKNNIKPGYEIVTIIDRFIIVKKDNKYAILDLNHKILKELDEEYGKLAVEPSGYYSSHNDKPEGMYLIIENGNDNCYEYYYDESKNELVKYNMEFCGGYAKPVLYLYPTKQTKVTVDFAHENMLTTTYPKFNGSWKVTANPNGDLYDKNGNYYYALYWEEQKNHTVDFKEGFYVESASAIKFLESKLQIIGLNAKERNEFIMYWLPILEKNGKNLVYFELTEERDSYNKLIINPKPDSILRIAMHVKKVNEKTNIKEQVLPTFKRKGFVAVEWGGILY